MNSTLWRTTSACRMTALKKTTALLTAGVLVSLSACGAEASAQSTAEGSIVINVKDWTAAGSGCRARKSKAGDVSFVDNALAPASSSSISLLKFKLPNYGLTSPPENPATSLTFARECALRVVAEPPKNFRIKSVAARTPVQFSKDATAAIKMQYMLRLDGEIIAHSLTEIEEGEAFRNREQQAILAGQRNDHENFSQQSTCGIPQMLGFDYTFIAARSVPSDSANITLAAEKLLELAVELEPCS
ncbi:MAG: hypothetical protein RJB13_1724 [Pseudomonadota bacterium]